MRSSVSYILSSTTTEPNMSHPDYEQLAHDHAALLVLVRQIGSQLKNKMFNKFYDRISRLNSVNITDSVGQVRNIYIRYVKEHPVENNLWGDFQTHRRLLGLVTFGKYDSQQELNDICRVHEQLKVKYITTLFDSRCILFGPSSDSPTEETTSSDATSSISSSTDAHSIKTTEKDLEKKELYFEENDKEVFTTPSNFKTRALFYSETDPCADLEAHLTDFLNSLFWVLESKRLERSREKLERVSLLLAPFEKKDFVGLDMESRNNKRRCTGRSTKHLGDLCLQAGLITEALTHYHNAAETLKSVNDWLWLGAAYEGLCTATALVLYPNIYRNAPLHRNSSLQEGSPKRSNSITTPILDIVKKEVPNTLPPEEISKKYREAIVHYSKYQNAGIIETEACFKAARISVEQNHPLQAASFLQNVVFINLTLSEQERIQRFETLSDLYMQIGFMRKASFCQRLAATRYVSAQNPTPNWSQCYNLMLQSFRGHKISLDPTEMMSTNVQVGWSTLQIQLLQEIVVAAKRMGHSALATRHMTFLLQTMWPYLSINDQKEFAIQLQSLSAQCEGSPVSLVLDNGTVIPPANLTNIPICAGFNLRNLQPHLRPRKIQVLKQDSGPFLFTPINFGSLERKSAKVQSKMDFFWIENDLCEVTLKLVNPLPFELKVSNMRLLTSGVVFESIPETVVLPSDTPTLVTLNGSPKESGELEVLGYSTHTLGVKSNCRLRYMKGFLPQYTIEVIPTLPTVEVKTSLPESATFSTFQNFENVVTSASLSLYNGESTQCVITIANTSQVPVEMLEVSIQSVLEPSLQDQIFKWSNDDLQKQLPLLPGNSASLTINLYSAANFLASGFNGPELSSGVFGSSHASSIMSASAGPSSLPSRLNSPVHSTMGNSFHGRRNDLNSSFRSSNSGQSSMTTTGCRSPGALTLPQHVASAVVDAQLQLRFSGGSGFQAGYCRSCSIFITLEMIPSMQVTNWDVLPAETYSQFYLVLDVANLTSQEMEVYYTPSKHMLIEGHESCRVPVPVDRCPLSKLTKFYMEQKSGLDDRLDLDKICSEHIANLVDLSWHLMSTDTRGKASLKGITLTPNMLDIVRMSPIQWEVLINDGLIKPQEEVNCVVGECLEIKVGVSNCFEKPLRQLTLSVQFYQDYQNGMQNYQLETRLAFTGTTKIILPPLEPQDKAKHACNVVFFNSGHYKMDIQCSAPECLASTPSVNTTGHIWRFLPAIEVNVN
ncbi:protein brunelleschi [Agrilus planipennis]|uniref:Protein brunelleschi n=1 Tax=Agrilus planipennis TaxID=224129 RepID=A0A1W4XDI3_AGRPL|nr:protein brunelleschi [Agrilus planipennis]